MTLWLTAGSSKPKQRFRLDACYLNRFSSSFLKPYPPYPAHCTSMYKIIIIKHLIFKGVANIWENVMLCTVTVVEVIVKIINTSDFSKLTFHFTWFETLLLFTSVLRVQPLFGTVTSQGTDISVITVKRLPLGSWARAVRIFQLRQAAKPLCVYSLSQWLGQWLTHSVTRSVTRSVTHGFTNLQIFTPGNLHHGTVVSLIWRLHCVIESFLCFKRLLK